MNKTILAGVAAGILVVGLIFSPVFSGSQSMFASAQDTGKTKTVTLIADEMEVQVAPDNPLHPGGIMYKAMVFNGTIPGPVIAVDQGDTLEITLVNEGQIIHSLDFHAGIGPSNALSGNVAAGESKTWTLEAVNSGVFLYHCGADGLNGVWEHIANGMYGGVVVHPQNEKPAKEFYVVFGEIYNAADKGPFVGSEGVVGSFDLGKLWTDNPDLILTNGMAHKYVPAIGAASKIPLNPDAELFMVKPGELTRWYIVNPGPNGYVAFHFISGMIDVRDGSIKNRYGTQVKNDETWTIPPGSATVIEATFPEEGVYVGVDHNMSHVLKGAAFAVVASNESTADDHPEGAGVPPRGSAYAVHYDDSIMEETHDDDNHDQGNANALEERIFHGTALGLLEKMQADIYEGSEEAFAAVLLDNDETEKAEFMQNMVEFDAAAEEYQIHSMLDQAEEEEEAALFDEIVAAKADLVESANAMFEASESGATDFTSFVQAFEEDLDAIDEAIGELEAIERQELEEAYEAAPPTDLSHGRHYGLLADMQADVLEGIEESLAYLLLDDESEKQDFMQKMADFDEAAEEYENTALKHDDDEMEANLFDGIIEAKADLVEAAEEMFVAFEEDSSDLANHIHIYEQHIDEITGLLDELEEIEAGHLEDWVEAGRPGHGVPVQ